MCRTAHTYHSFIPRGAARENDRSALWASAAMPWGIAYLRVAWCMRRRNANAHDFCRGGGRVTRVWVTRAHTRVVRCDKRKLTKSKKANNSTERRIKSKKRERAKRGYENSKRVPQDLIDLQLQSARRRRDEIVTNWEVGCAFAKLCTSV